MGQSDLQPEVEIPPFVCIRSYKLQNRYIPYHIPVSQLVYYIPYHRMKNEKARIILGENISRYVCLTLMQTLQEISTNYI